MKTVKYMARDSKLIHNGDLQFDMNFHFSGAEADLLSVLANGKKSVITSDDLKTYLQGVFERMLMENVTVEDKRDLAIAIAKQNGMSEKQLNSYIRGWDQVGATIEGDAVNALARKFGPLKLKPYQVSENDVVAACDAEQALQVFNEFIGADESDVNSWLSKDFKVKDLSNKLDVMLVDENDNQLCTLAELMADIKQPKYLYGWE